MPAAAAFGRMGGSTTPYAKWLPHAKRRRVDDHAKKSSNQTVTVLLHGLDFRLSFSVLSRIGLR
jgi:hypothetical protein